MNEDPNEIRESLLPKLWDELRRGRHISIADGALFYDLERNLDSYSETLRLLGYTLVRDDHHFYYLTIPDRTRSGSRVGLSRIISIGLVLFDALNSAGQTFDAWAFGPDVGPRRIADLPFFGTEDHRRILRMVEIENVGHLSSAMKDLHRLGFVEISADAVRFLPPMYRLRDLCMEIAKLGPGGLEKLRNEAVSGVEAEGDENDES